MMKVLIIGASGATGKQLVHQLINMGYMVKIIVRSSVKLPTHWMDNENIIIIKGNISEISVQEMAKHIRDCQAVVSCLGHNITLKGIYGNPRKLVTDAVRLTCTAIKRNAAEKPVKFVLMNTTGNRNKDLDERISFGERLVVGLIRMLVPPHPDNEQAAEYLRKTIGQNDASIEWVVVRPDALIDQDDVTEYKLYPSPVRSAVFNPGKTSRINVGHLMAQLIVNNHLWESWKGKMPVIYNTSE